MRIVQPERQKYFQEYWKKNKEDIYRQRKGLRGKRSHYNVGKNHPCWKGGRFKASDGYIYIYQPTHPCANINKYVFEHRLIMEKYLGKKLKKNEVVHHIDGNKSNNNISNLQAMSNREHMYLHTKLNFEQGKEY